MTPRDWRYVFAIKGIAWAIIGVYGHNAGFPALEDLGMIMFYSCLAGVALTYWKRPPRRR